MPVLDCLKQNQRTPLIDKVSHCEEKPPFLDLRRILVGKDELAAQRGDVVARAVRGVGGVELRHGRRKHIRHLLCNK